MTMRAVASAHFSEEIPLKTLIDWHRRQYPLMEPQDVVKLVFQAMLGCGHLLGDESIVAQRIAAEMDGLAPSPAEPLTEPLGRDYVRLNLRRAKADGLPPLWIARLMKTSTSEQANTRLDAQQAIAALGDPDASAIAQRLLDEPNWLPSHTPAYHAAYAPAYRVISRRCAKALPVLQAAAKLQENPRALICIDGPCASGKTTLGALLQTVLDAALVPMDDFFLPHPKKTPERLAQPGGNADWERLAEEVLTPWLKGEPVCYHPYDCHANALGNAVSVPDRQFTIIEGSYSLLPVIGQHADLRVFLAVDAETQQHRILHRNGEGMLQMFIQRWIPLEQTYHTAYGLPDQSCLMIPDDEQLT